MTMSTNAAGIACCGNCGSEVHVVCSGGCAEPDVIPRENYIATMRRPRKGESPQTNGLKEDQPTQCTWPGGCESPPKPWCGRGRKPRMCAFHGSKVRSYVDRYHAKKATSNGETP